MPYPPNQSSRQIVPHTPLPEYYSDSSQRQEFVRELFDHTAQDYDWINQMVSFGTGRWYREWTLRRAGLSEGMRVIDVACGTGLVTRCAASIVGLSGSVIGLDTSVGMLLRAQQRGCKALVQARAEHLPFPDAFFDVVSMGYALRHMSDLKTTFMEYMRVLKPGGALLILEISRPRSGVAFRLARVYLKSIVPWMAWLGTGNSSAQTLMRYFWDTIEQCVPAEVILAGIKEAGFNKCRLSERFGGLIRDYTAAKP